MTSIEESGAVTVAGEEREHPAVRRLARSCIALARWRRSQPLADQGDDGQERATTPPGGRS